MISENNKVVSDLLIFKFFSIISCFVCKSKHSVSIVEKLEPQGTKGIGNRLYGLISICFAI